MSDEENKVVDEIVRIEISKDRMLGVISFMPPENGGKSADIDAIRKAINDCGITYGIINENVEELAQGHIYGSKYIIAKGKAPIDGQDGSIEFLFDTKALKELKPRINPDGTVDLKDLGAVKNVSKGDKLAQKIPATLGEDGFNVLGQPLKAKKGKEARIPKGKNTVILSDGITLVADIDGKLEYDEHNVYVNSVFNVMGDVDSSIGNIDFVGDIVIYGNINSGFKVKAGGTVEVKGSVEDAVIIAGKDIILTYGIQGTERSKIVAGGNIMAKFLQNAHATAGGSITTEAILHSNVTAGDSIHSEAGKGTIVGGNVSATNLIMARSIGSSMGTVTALQIGIPSNVYVEYRELGEKLKQKKENITKVDQGIKFLLAKTQGGGLSAQKKELLAKFNATRQPLVEEYEAIKEKYNSLGERLNNVQEGIVKFSDTIYPGVKVTFGNLIKYIDERYTHTVIRKSEGDIIIE